VQTNTISFIIQSSQCTLIVNIARVC